MLCFQEETNLADRVGTRLLENLNYFFFKFSDIMTLAERYAITTIALSQLISVDNFEKVHLEMIEQ